MILVDAIYINNGGGRVLLEYLIQELNNDNTEIMYLIDERYDGILPDKKNKVHIISPSLLWRHFFYLKHRETFSKVFCFGNVPPPIKLEAEVFTYFHQYLFLINPGFSNILNWGLINVKKSILKHFKRNTNKWVVQSSLVCEKLIVSLELKREDILIIPFYRSFNKSVDVKRERQFLYVSSGEPHKNHLTLIRAFKLFYDQYKLGSLHLTVPLHYTEIINLIDGDYPIYNYYNLNELGLKKLFFESEYFIFPSKFESFGLGIVEAIECGCKVLGADLPYLHQICSPSDVFDPDSLISLQQSLERAFLGNLKDSKLKVSNEIVKLLHLIKS